MSPIQFGLILPDGARDTRNRNAFVADVNRALDLIAGHFDSVWITDHLQFADRDVLESFTSLSYLSALHPDLKFGTSVLCQSFRNPALVAKMAASLQFITGGRFILGLGAGWYEEEYHSYGYEFPPAPVRVRQLEEAIQIIQKMWHEDGTTFDGDYYQVNEAYCHPRPDPVPPLMLGAFKPEMLRLTARYADWWNASSTSLADYRSMAVKLERYCREMGRDPAAVKKTWGGGCVCAPTPEQLVALSAEPMSPEEDGEDFDFLGTPQQLIAQMRPFIELGVEYFMLDCGGFPDLTTLKTLIQEVIPVLREDH